MESKPGASKICLKRQIIDQKNNPNLLLKKVLHLISASCFSAEGLYSQITDGASHAMGLAILGLCGPPGTKEKPLLVFDPTYSNYASMAERTGRSLAAFPRYLEEDGTYSMPSKEEIERLIEEKKPAAILVIPYDNPTGQFFPQNRLNELAALCVKYNLWLLSDEAYRELFYIPMKLRFLIYLAAFCTIFKSRRRFGINSFFSYNSFMARKIPLGSLILLIVASIDSIRNLPAAALFGAPLIFFFIASAIIFLIPVAMVSAELSASDPEEGGVYSWVSRAFGAPWGMAAVWLQWINTMIWYPSFLSFLAGTAAYLIDPSLSESKWFLVGSILVIFWGMTFLNFFGIHASAKVNDLFASAGTMFPMLLLIALGVYWAASGKPLQIQIETGKIFPSLAESANWVSLIAIMASFLGMELAGVHAGDIRDPQRNFPKAVLLSSAFILFSMLFGSLAIAFVVPENEINLVAGVMQVFTAFFTSFGLEWGIPVMAILIVLGALGGLINWMVSPAKGLLHAAKNGFFPRYFAEKNRHGASWRILVCQAVLVSLFCAIFSLLPSVNAFYWFMTALSTSMYMLMYVLMFLSALRLRARRPLQAKTFRVPCLGLAVFFGLFACFATIVVSFIPPDNIDIGTPGRYTSLIGIGVAASLLPLPFFNWYRKKNT